MASSYPSPSYPLHIRAELAEYLPSKDSDIEQIQSISEYLGMQSSCGSSGEGQTTKEGKAELEAGSQREVEVETGSRREAGSRRESRKGARHTLKRKASDPPQKKPSEKLFPGANKFVERANGILQKKKVKCLEFLNVGNVQLKDHPTSTAARADIIAYNPHRSACSPPLWSSVEITAEFRSAGTKYQERKVQALSYAIFLLQARPDLHFTLGLLVEHDSMIVYVCSHSGIGIHQVESPDCLSTLEVIIDYLVSGQLKAKDSSLDRTPDLASGSSSSFDLACPNSISPTKVLPKCRHKFSSHPLGRRTNIFTVSKPSSVRVVKDQYKKMGRKWTEEDILKHIHGDGGEKRFPGVVFALFFEEYRIPSGNYVKTRIGLEEEGTAFMDLKTPREVLHAIYDLLEVTRSLFEKRRVLHRDISASNFVIPRPGNTTLSKNGSPVFIKDLLNTKDGRRNPSEGSSIILIDFDRAERYDGQAQFSHQTGTPIFMACAIALKRAFPETQGQNLPFVTLDAKANQLYGSHYPERMEIFQNCLPSDESSSPGDNNFRHELRHDGESIVWVFLYWLLHVFPEGQGVGFVKIAFNYREMFFGDAWDRHALLGLFTQTDENHVLHKYIHTGYAALVPLAKLFSQVVVKEYHWACIPVQRHAEYVHDALQRAILNFLLDPENAPVLDTKAASEFRGSKPRFSNSPSLSENQSQSRRTSSLSSQSNKIPQKTSKSYSTSSSIMSIPEQDDNATDPVPIIAGDMDYSDEESLQGTFAVEEDEQNITIKRRRND